MSIRVSLSSFLSIAVAALALGCTSHAPPQHPPGGENEITWERVGDEVRLTARTPGHSYLVFSRSMPMPRAEAAAQAEAPVIWSGSDSVTVTPPVTVYRLEPVFGCENARGCGLPCVKEGCTVPPKPPYRVQVLRAEE